MKKFFLFILILNCVNCNQYNISENKSSLDSINDENKTYFQKNESNYQVLSILLKKNNDSINREKILKIVHNLYGLNNWQALKFATDQLVQRSKYSNDLNHLAHAYRYYGLFYENKSINDSAFYYYSKAQKIFINKKNFQQTCILYQDKALIQYYTNNFFDSEFSLIQGLQLALRYKFYKDIYTIYINLGLNAREQKNYESALQYFNKALFFFGEKKIKFHDYHFEYCQNNIGYIYLLKNDFRIANEIFTGAMKNKDLYKDPVIYTRLLDNYSKCRLELNNYNGIVNLLNKSFTYKTNMGISEGKNFNRLFLSEYYIKTKDTFKAQYYAHQAYNLSKNFRAPKDILLCLKHLSKVDPRNALKYSNEYIKISDSMHMLERETRNKFAKIAFETEEISQEKDLAEKQKTIFLGTTITVTVIGLLLFVIILQRNRQKELVYLQNQQSAKEEIYQLIHAQQSKLDEGRQIEKRRIARDLHDGIMNKLASVRFNLHILNTKTDDKTIKRCLPFIDEIHDIEKEIRDISHNLNKEFFSNTNSFRDVLLTFFEEQKIIMKPKLHIDIDSSIKWELLESSKKVNIYRILQEILQNVNKHAQADNVFINITNHRKSLILEIHDDGIGFIEGYKKNGIGLENIRSRTKDCKGVFHVTSNNGNGATIIVSIPIHNQNKA